MDYEDLLMLQHQLEEFHQSIRDAEHIFAIHNDIFPRSLLVSEIKIISEIKILFQLYPFTLIMIPLEFVWFIVNE